MECWPWDDWRYPPPRWPAAADRRERSCSTSRRSPTRFARSPSRHHFATYPPAIDRASSPHHHHHHHDYEYHHPRYHHNSESADYDRRSRDRYYRRSESAPRRASPEQQQRQPYRPTVPGTTMPSAQSVSPKQPVDRRAVLRALVLSLADYKRIRENKLKLNDGSWSQGDGSMTPIPVPLEPGESVREYEDKLRVWLLSRKVVLEDLRDDPLQERNYRYSFANLRWKRDLPPGVPNALRPRPKNDSNDSYGAAGGGRGDRGPSRFDLGRTTRKRSRSAVREGSCDRPPRKSDVAPHRRDASERVQGGGRRSASSIPSSSAPGPESALSPTGVSRISLPRTCRALIPKPGAPLRSFVAAYTKCYCVKCLRDWNLKLTERLEQMATEMSELKKCLPVVLDTAAAAAGAANVSPAPVTAATTPTTAGADGEQEAKTSDKNIVRSSPPTPASPSPSAVTATSEISSTPAAPSGDAASTRAPSLLGSTDKESDTGFVKTVISAPAAPPPTSVPTESASSFSHRSAQSRDDGADGSRVDAAPSNTLTSVTTPKISRSFDDDVLMGVPSLSGRHSEQLTQSGDVAESTKRSEPQGDGRSCAEQSAHTVATDGGSVGGDSPVDGIRESTHSTSPAASAPLPPPPPITTTTASLNGPKMVIPDLETTDLPASRESIARTEEDDVSAIVDATANGPPSTTIDVAAPVPLESWSEPVSVKAQMTAEYDALNRRILRTEKMLQDAVGQLQQRMLTDMAGAFHEQEQIRVLRESIVDEMTNRDAAVAMVIAYCWVDRRAELEAQMAQLGSLDIAHVQRGCHVKCAELSSQIEAKRLETSVLRSEVAQCGAVSASDALSPAAESSSESATKGGGVSNSFAEGVKTRLAETESAVEVLEQEQMAQFMRLFQFSSRVRSMCGQILERGAALESLL